MAAIILGKNLLTADELIEHAFGELNTHNLNLRQLNEFANDSAIHSSLMLIRMMKADRIYIQTSRKNKPGISRPSI